MEITEGKFDGVYCKFFKNNKNVYSLLFLHGLTGDSSIWDDYIEILIDKFNLIFIDLLGHGRADTPKKIEEYLFQNQAEKITKVLEAFKIKSFSIISYSFSCGIGLLIQEKNQKKVENLIFISPCFKEKNFIERVPLKIVDFVWRCLIPNKKFQLDYSKLINYENPTFSDISYILKCNNTKDLLGSFYAFKNQKNTDLEKLKIPVLIICGENDEKAKKLFIKRGTLELKILDNKKHLFLKTNVHRIAKFIEMFSL